MPILSKHCLQHQLASSLLIRRFPKEEILLSYIRTHTEKLQQLQIFKQMALLENVHKLWYLNVQIYLETVNKASHSKDSVNGNHYNSGLHCIQTHAMQLACMHGHTCHNCLHHTIRQ